MIKLSDYVFQFLKDKGVKDIFMLPGGGAMHLVDSLGKSGISYVHFQHEQAATIASEAYGQHTNHIGVTLVTSGPGATNTITGVTAGWIDSTPMMVISGQAKRSDLIGDKGVRQIGSQEVTIVEIVKPITKYAEQVFQPEKIKYCLQKAYYEATNGRKGPVWLDIPLDVQATMIEPDALEEFIPNNCVDSYSQLDTKLLENIMQHIRKAKKPLILAGNGICSAHAEAAFLKLIEKLQFPTQTTWKSVDLMWDNHPLYAGHPGGLGDRGANFIIQECDLLLSLGTRIDNSITAFNELEFATNAYKIVVDIDKNELNKFIMKIDEPICCDVKDFIESLNTALTEKDVSRVEEWNQYCRDIRRQYPIVLEEYGEKEGCVDGYYFTNILSDLLTEQDVIVPESAGVTAEVTIQAFRNKNGQRMKHAAGLGSMGFGLPYAIGSCIANGNRRTILINGDGAFQLNIQELETLHRLWLPIKIFIWNNQGYASIRGMQRNNFSGHYVASDKGSGLTLPDLSKVAAAYGLKTYKISNNTEVMSGIKMVLAMEGPILCEVMIDPDEVVMPKVQARIGEDGNMVAGRLDRMWPFLQ